MTEKQGAAYLGKGSGPGIPTQRMDFTADRARSQVSSSPFLAATDSADAIQWYLLDRLAPVLDKRGKPSKNLYLYCYAGLVGQLAPRAKPDSKGRIVFVLYEKKSAVAAHHLSFRRDKKKFPRAPKPIFLTATNVFAHLEGYQGKFLARDEYHEWNVKLFSDIGLNASGDDDDAPTKKFALFGPYRHAGDEFRRPSAGEKSILNKKRGLYEPHRRLMYEIWQHFARRWEASAKAISPRTGTATGWPRAIKAADVYLAVKLGAGRVAVARAIRDLDSLGYIQAVRYQPSGRIDKKGIYWYFPGEGKPPKQPTRRRDVTPQGAWLG